MAPSGKRQRTSDSNGQDKTDKSYIMESLLSIDIERLEQEANDADDETFWNVLERVRQIATKLEESTSSHGGSDSRKPSNASNEMELDEENVADINNNNNNANGRRRTSARIAARNQAIANSRIPAEVLRLVCRSSFLTTPELGRFLLFVSKSVTLNLGGPDEVWYHLCNNRLQDSIKQIPQSLVNAKGLKWLFHQLHHGLAKKEIDFTAEESLLEEPQLSPNNVMLVLQVSASQKVLISELIAPDDLVNLFQDGQLKYKLQTPVSVEKTETLFLDWSCTIHAIRLDTNQCCCIFDTTSRKFKRVNIDDDDDDGGSFSSLFQDVEGRARGVLKFKTHTLGLALTDHGEALERRIQDWFHQTDDRFEECDIYDGFQFVPMLLSVLDDDDDQSATPTKQHFTHVYIRAAHVFHHGRAELFTSDNTPPSHGVELCHMLHELYGWEENPTEWHKLRFEVGTILWCRMGNDPFRDWSKGKVKQLWYREPKWPRGSWAAYKIRLNDGPFIYAPSDTNNVVRLLHPDGTPAHNEI